ncbi:GATS protein-like 3 [Rhizophlyctis rosea]|nr:GATS protein-like 3 [Rhizophlyctis rosea]
MNEMQVKEKRIPMVISTLEAHGFEFADLEDLDIPLTPTSHNDPISAATPEPLSASFEPPSHIMERESGSISPKSLASSRAGEPLIDPRLLDKKLVPGNTLRLVGLNREYVDHWAMQIIKIIFYPDVLIDGRRGSRASTPITPRLFSYTSTEEGISLVADETVLEQFPEHFLNMSVLPRPLKCIQVDLTAQGMEASGTDRYGIVYSMADPLAAGGINLLFLSTFMTSNVLVNASDLSRALAILHVVREDAALQSPISTPRASPDEPFSYNQTEDGFFGGWEDEEEGDGRSSRTPNGEGGMVSSVSVVGVNGGHYDDGAGAKVLTEKLGRLVVDTKGARDLG